MRKENFFYKNKLLMSTQEEINSIFKKWENFLLPQEEYIPVPVISKPETPPPYVATPKTAGPKRISIQQYKERTQKYKDQVREFREQNKNFKPKKRGGNKRRFEKACTELQNVINIAKGNQKKNLIAELSNLREKGWQKF